jgi:hypothetical protein
MSDKEQPVAIGRIVHYRWANPETGSQQSECQPALITLVFANGAVNLSVFDSTGHGVHGATAMRDPKSDPKNGSSWHWPMECSVRWTPVDFEPILGVREP